jgi:hypothetical protein
LRFPGSETGLITTLVELDREQREQYELVVLVRDNGTPARMTSKDLIVRVSDIDDYVPHFPDEYKASVASPGFGNSRQEIEANVRIRLTFRVVIRVNRAPGRM